MLVRAVMFDFGATLVLDDKFDYFGSLRKAHKVLEDAGIAPAFEQFKTVYLEVRGRLWSDSEFREHTYVHRLAEVLKLCGHEVSESDRRLRKATDVFLYALVDSLCIEDHVPRVLKELRERYKLAVVSNLGIPEVVPITLERFDIKKYFDVILASGTVGYRKPSPIIFKEALKALDVLPGETAFVGDSLYHDVQGAKAVGMKTIWLKRGNQAEEKVAVVPDETICSLAELFKALETFEGIK
jgi:HAD superfamily hydrolase (TIGR01662 family)